MVVAVITVHLANESNVVPALMYYGGGSNLCGWYIFGTCVAVTNFYCCQVFLSSWSVGLFRAHTSLMHTRKFGSLGVVATLDLKLLSNLRRSSSACLWRSRSMGFRTRSWRRSSRRKFDHPCTPSEMIMRQRTREGGPRATGHVPCTEEATNVALGNARRQMAPPCELAI